MSVMGMSGPAEFLRRCASAALAAVDGEMAVRCRIEHRRGGLVIAGELLPLPSGRAPVLLAVGKAAAAMAAGALAALGAVPPRSLVVTRHGHARPDLPLRQLEAGHPVPDEAGVAASLAVEEMVSGLDRDDLLLLLLSGGASALLPAPVPGLTLADLQTVTGQMLASGADIASINAIRRRCSRLAGGGLARLAAPARVRTLAIVDTPDGDPLTVGSGPTVPNWGGAARAVATADRWQLWGSLPPAVVAHLRHGGPEPVVDADLDIRWVRIAGNAEAVAAALAEARRHQCEVRPHVFIEGEANVVGAAFAWSLQAAPAGTLLLAGAETTVVLPPDHGLGGRNQQLALSAARAFSGGPPAHLLALGSDGTDGPTDAAGALVDHTTWRRAGELGLDPVRALERCDTYPVLDPLGCLLRIGPTGTNVMDVILAVR